MTHPIPTSALDDRLGFVGTAGSGKTYNASGSVERLLDSHARVVIVDPLDVWWGLRLIADGSAPSRYSMPIFGGAHGDLPLNEHVGALIGETVAGMAESCIVSLGGLTTKAAERRFMLSFLDAIYRKASGEPVHLVFDEADLWAPQKTSEPMLQARMEEICRRGRVKGLIPWLITQRPAVISKDVLSQVDGLVAFKLTSSQDRDALEGWIEGQADRQQWKDIRAALPTLQQGHGVVWIPGRGVLETAHFPVKRTFDSSRTPKRGEKKRTAALRPLDLASLKERLSTVETEAKANDPKTLRAEIAELKRQIAKAPAAQAVPDPQALAAAEQRGRAAGFREGWDKGYERGVWTAAERIRQAELLWNPGDRRKEVKFETADRHPVGRFFADDIMSLIGGKLSDPAMPSKSSEPPRLAPPKANGSHAPTPRPVAAPKGDGTLTTPQRRVIASLAFWNSVGDDAPTREQVAGVAGYSPGSGNFNNVLSGLRTMGAIDYPSGGRLRLVDEGLADGVMSRSEARDVLQGVFAGPQKKIVGILIESREDELTREEIAERSDYSAGSGNFNNLLSSLRTLSVVDYPSKGRVALAPWVRTVMAR